MSALEKSDRRPWEPRPREGAKAYAAFVQFRDLGSERTLARTAALAGKSISLIQDWSARYKWADRVAEYDLHMARIRQETAEDEVANQRSMETAAAAAAFTLVIRRLAGDPDDETVKALNPNDLDPGEVARLGDFFVRTGRLALGQPTDVIKGGIAIHPAEVTRIVQQIVGHALKWMAADVPPAAMQEGFVRDVEALGGAS